MTMTKEGGTLKNLGWNVRGLNVRLSSPSAEGPVTGGEPQEPDTGSWALRESQVPVY